MLCVLGSKAHQKSSGVQQIFGGIAVVNVSRSAGIAPEFVTLNDDYNYMETGVKLKSGTNTVAFAMKRPDQARGRTAQSDQLDVYNFL